MAREKIHIIKEGGEAVSSNLIQPKGFFPLFLIEMVSRFSFWGVQSLLLIYLIYYFEFTPHEAYSAFSNYTALTYGFTIIGGLLADRLFGSRQLVIIGAGLALIGGVLIVFPNINLLHIALCFLVMGIGFLISNVANMLGRLYDDCDNLRDKGFAIFYVATNVGGVVAPVVFSVVNKCYGWGWAFSLAAVPVLIWLLVYCFYYKEYKKIDVYKERAPWFFWLIFPVLFIFVYVVINERHVIASLLYSITAAVLLYFVCNFISLNKTERRNVGLLIIFSFFALYFFSCEFQILTSFVVFIDNYVDGRVAGIDIPSSAFISVEPFFVIVLSPLSNFLWSSKLSKKLKLSPFTKMIYGIGCLAVSFLFFELAAYICMQHQQRVPMLWVLIGLFVMALGEVLIMPPLISAITRYAPAKFKGTMIGFLYLLIAFSSYFAGEIAKLAEPVSRSMVYFNNAVNYQQLYLNIFSITFCLFLIMFLVDRYFLNFRKADVVRS